MYSNLYVYTGFCSHMCSHRQNFTDMHTTLPFKDTAPGGEDTERFAQILLGGRGGPDGGRGAAGGPTVLPAGWRGGSMGAWGVHCELKSCVHVVELCVQGVCSCVMDVDVCVWRC